MPTLEQWKEPIDILVALFGFVFIHSLDCLKKLDSFSLVDRPDVPINEDLEKDELLMFMQNFYQNLSRIPREVLIIQEIGPVFKNPLYQVIY